MTIQANAKVNLVLRILGKRTDGYHEIETLMVPVTLADELEVVVAAGTGITIACDDPSVPADTSNLAWRAAEAFARESGLTFRTSIILRKRIPHGAGLGGGSSDAAATLKALDALLETKLGDKALEKIAATIGSDVPFFIQNKPSWCRGRGELLEAAGQLPPTKLLLIKPPFPVSTAWAYQAAGAGRRPSEPQRLGGLEICNDFEGPVFQKFLLLPAIKSWLFEQPEVDAAMMSGSGSTLFAILRGNAMDLDRPGLAARATERFGGSLWVSECSTLSS
ncbi:MAG: 4-(cytidine 5'-diphospho)-2-C-methyl-D-erythritol kinase [Verrucomicrobiae bacterium]